MYYKQLTIRNQFINRSNISPTLDLALLIATRFICLLTIFFKYLAHEKLFSPNGNI